MVMYRALIVIICTLTYNVQLLCGVRLRVGTRLGAVMAKSNQFGRGQTQKHNGAPISQSGTQRFNQAPKPPRGNRGGRSIGEQLAGYTYSKGLSDPMSHGGSKKNVKRKKR